MIKIYKPEIEEKLHVVQLVIHQQVLVLAKGHEDIQGIVESNKGTILSQVEYGGDMKLGEVSEMIGIENIPEGWKRGAIPFGPNPGNYTIEDILAGWEIDTEEEDG